MKRSLIIILTILIVCESSDARSQDLISPLLSHAVKGVLWISGNSYGNPSQNYRPILRGGAALSIRIQGEKTNKDTITSPFDSIYIKEKQTTTLYERYLAPVSDTITINGHKFTENYVPFKPENDENLHEQKFTPEKLKFFSQFPKNFIVTVGYEFSEVYKYNIGIDYTYIPPIRGIYLGGFTTYKLWKKQRSDFVIGFTLGIFGISSTNVFVNDRTNSPISISMSSATIVSPEVYLLGYKRGPFFTQLSYKFLHFAPIQYSVPSSNNIDPNTIYKLPRDIDLNSINLTVGVAFPIKGLYGK
jgi:hypothetical protein